MAEICRLAELSSVPVVFALNRLSLGSIFGMNKRMSGEFRRTLHTLACAGVLRAATPILQRPARRGQAAC